MEETQVQETVGSAIADPTILNQQSADTIVAMLRSSDEGDHKMAQLLLTKVNVEKSIYWIWYIATKSHCTDRMVNLRTKAGRSFRDDSNLFGIAYMRAAKFTRWLNDKQWLTPEIYNYAKAEIMNELRYNVRGVDAARFYEFKFELKPEYKHLDLEDHMRDLDKITKGGDHD